jgi:hypothetical protein
MLSVDLHINQKQFEIQFAAFSELLAEQESIPFHFLSSNPFSKEKYKYEIYKEAKKRLDCNKWSESDIGTGKILGHTISSIEIPGNNLVRWDNRYGKESRQHNYLYEAKNDQRKTKELESCIYAIYHKESDAQSFESIMKIIGKKYSLIAYLFFIKDRSKYLPIATTIFDIAFRCFNVDFITSYHCSWDNYSTYLRLVGELKEMLTEILGSEVTLLDAHSFAWIIGRERPNDGKFVDSYKNHTNWINDSYAYVKTRLGQNKFAEKIIKYWGSCAVSGCTETSILEASHIKPWSKSTYDERLSVYNGLLLLPTLHKCFDQGLISFNEKGCLLISDRLSEFNLRLLGLHKSMKLRNVRKEHLLFLKYHHDNIFK